MQINKTQFLKVLNSATHREDIVIYLFLHYIDEGSFSRANIGEWLDISYICVTTATKRLVKLGVIDNNLSLISYKNEYFNLPLTKTQIKYLRNNEIQILQLKWFFNLFLDIKKIDILNITVSKSSFKCLKNLAKMKLINIDITPNLDFNMEDVK